jgi:hypothetical protein
MTLSEAKEVLNALLSEFCFQTEQDRTNAIAALLTPYLRGLLPKFNTRTPIFFYIANREGAGKDYLAGITGIVHEGYALEDPPISTDEELRKNILAAAIGGRKRLHFANNKGYLNNSMFESIATAERYSDRVLGKSEKLTFDNEFDFSLSGNTGIRFTPDFGRRCRFIRLFLEIEDANKRKFKNPDLHGWVRDHRGEVLSALYALIRNWVDNKQPSGTLLFSSYPHWAEICGGIMETAGYQNPCMPDTDVLALGGDTDTQEMKVLFEACYEKFPDEPIAKSQIKDVAQEYELFGYIDFDDKSDQIKFGQKLIRFIGRILSDIRLRVEDSKVRSARQKFIFEKIVRDIEPEIEGQLKLEDASDGTTPSQNAVHASPLDEKRVVEKIVVSTNQKIRDGIISDIKAAKGEGIPEKVILSKWPGSKKILDEMRDNGDVNVIDKAYYLQ